METTLADFVFAVVLGSGLFVILVSLVSAFLHRQSERQSLRRRVICRLCLHVYQDSGESGLSECPSCHAVNERGSRA